MMRCGLYNGGNQCFINAAIQCLAISPVINEFIGHYSKEDLDMIQAISKFKLGKFKVDEINIYDCANDREVDGIDINYLIEQNHYKQLTTDDAKQKYKQLNNSEKILDIKKQLIANIMKT